MDKSAAQAILQLQDLKLTYSQGSRDIHVLAGAKAVAMAGEAIGLLGPSGSGKSSLLHIIGLLDQPNSGAVII